MPWLLFASFAGFLLYFVHPSAASISDLCGRVDLAVLSDPLLRALFIGDPKTLIFDWCIMLVLMMPPLLSQQILYIWQSNLPDRRSLSLALYVLGYFCVWMLSGFILVPIAMVWSALLPGFAATILAILVALLWSSSPLAQFARNMCHRYFPIQVRGIGWVRDNLSHGTRKGLFCVGTCWVWMIVPLTVQNGHFTMMILVAIYLLADRLAPGARLRWRIPPALLVFGIYKPTRREWSR